MMTTKKSRVDPAAAVHLPRPRRRFAQHFLEPAWAARVVAACNPQPADVFLEIGPGRGALTTSLAARATSVVAIELDRDLAAWLADRVPPNVDIVSADALEADWPALLTKHVQAGADPPRMARVVGNLPYNVSSPLLFRLLAVQRARRIFQDATLMLQQEVADRLVALPGSKTYGVLSILVGLHADVTRLLQLPPGAFRPMPRVGSAVVQLAFRPPPVPIMDYASFEALVRSVFTRRRKMLVNAIAPFARAHGSDAKRLLAAAGLDPSRRPESLELQEIEGLVEALRRDFGRAVL